jgi:hypothetical protein
MARAFFAVVWAQVVFCRWNTWKGKANMKRKDAKRKRCATCAAWVPGGMCRLLRVDREGTLYQAHNPGEPLQERHVYATGTHSFFGCACHQRGTMFALPSPSGFWFGSPWNVCLGGEVLLWHFPDSQREALFALCDDLNRRYDKLLAASRPWWVRVLRAWRGKET